MDAIGKLLKTLRKEAGFTQEEFGRRIGVSKQAVSNYEADIRRPDYETLEAIADVLNKPIGFFISPEEQQKELTRINGSFDEKTQKINEILQLASRLTPDKLAVAESVLKALAENP